MDAVAATDTRTCPGRLLLITSVHAESIGKDYDHGRAPRRAARVSLHPVACRGAPRTGNLFEAFSFFGS